MHSTNRLPGLDLAEQMEARRPVSAWLISLLVHAALFVSLALTVQMVPRGVAVEPDRPVGIVLVHQQEGKREYFDPLADDAARDQSALAALSGALPAESENPIDLSEALPGAEQLTRGFADSILDATQLTGDGMRRRGGIDGGISTEVFGVTGTGSKFVYVFDRSGSMDGYGGRPLKAAKLELTRSLDELERVHQFQIIFYNEKPKIFDLRPGTPQFAWGDEESKQAARQFVRDIKARGSTQHLDALELALGMRPDVVFFLTDAGEQEQRLQAKQLDDVRNWNRGAMLHVIEFGAGPQADLDNVLMRLARENGGQHAYVDVLRLRDLP